MGQSIRMQVTAAVAAAVLVSFFVLRTSQAAFTGSTASAGNTFAAGSVSLSNDAATGATWTGGANMGPGETATGCITVEYTGTLTPSQNVDLAVSSTSTLNMAPYMDVEVRVGADCATAAAGGVVLSGTLDGLSTSDTGWLPTASGQTQAFHVTVTMNGAIPSDEQGDSTEATFTWTATDAA